MKLLRKFLHLSRTDRWLLVRSLGVVAVIRLALSVLPFRTLWRLLQQATARYPSTPSSQSDISINRLTWSIQKTSRCVPQATCLTQAAAAYLLLSRHGYPAEIRIGVGKSENGKFEAHAWVESEGKVVIGGSGPTGADVTRWTPLPSLERCKC